jgi:conjugal transfer ATP-binding protein TraC
MSSGDYNEDEKLNRQVVDPGIDLKVHPSHIRMALPETSTRAGHACRHRHAASSTCSLLKTRVALRSGRGLTICRICASLTSAYPVRLC